MKRIPNGPGAEDTPVGYVFGNAIKKTLVSSGYAKWFKDEDMDTAPLPPQEALPPPEGDVTAPSMEPMLLAAEERKKLEPVEMPPELTPVDPKPPPKLTKKKAKKKAKKKSGR